MSYIMVYIYIYTCGIGERKCAGARMGCASRSRGDGGGTGTTGNAHDPQPLKPVVRPFGFSQRPSDASAYIACGGAHARATDRRNTAFATMMTISFMNTHTHTHTAMYTMYT